MHFPPRSRVNWPATYRIITSRHPPVDLFERIIEPAKREQLARLEMLTDPHVRDQIGEIALVPESRRVFGPGATWVMSAFTHIRKDGSRFSDGTYGVYYAAHSFETAIRETVHHAAKFFARTHEPPCRSEYRVLRGSVDHEFHDIRGGKTRWRSFLDPDDYSASRTLAQRLRAKGSDGIVYPSVRHPGGECLAAFWPDVVGLPVVERRLAYHWNGERIDKYIDFSEDTWHPLEP